MFHRPKKFLGQNFLVDRSIIRHIVDVVAVERPEVIIEIGPGRGALSDELVKTGIPLVLIEFDADLSAFLQERYVHYSHVRVICGDVRRVHIVEEVKKSVNLKDGDIAGFLVSRVRYVVVGNLPYYITASILRLVCELTMPPQASIFMVQREVADRITATAGSYSILGVSVQLYAQPERLFDVPATAFDPMPKVTSSVVRLGHFHSSLQAHCLERSGDISVGNEDVMRLVRMGFSSRRKTLVNNLSNGFHLSKETFVPIIESLSILPTTRAQELSLDQWRILVQKLEKCGILKSEKLKAYKVENYSH